MSSTRISRRVNAPRERVYRALLDPRAVATWMVPTGMTSHVHEFEAREGGAFRISLTYDAPTGTGKTTAHTDTYHGRFVTLVPNVRVIEAVEFETTGGVKRSASVTTVHFLPAGGRDPTYPLRGCPWGGGGAVAGVSSGARPVGRRSTQDSVMSSPAHYQKNRMKSPVMIRVGGAALIGGALAFVAVFAFLAARFDYPAILDGPAETVLPLLLATGSSGRAAWAMYAFLPLLWIPAGVAAHVALRRSHPGAMLLALQCATVAAISMMLGLMRWPSIHWRLAELYVVATPDQRPVLASIFDGLNVYLGNYLGEFLGELSFSAFLLLTSWALLRARAAPRWIAAVGLITGAAGLVGMFRNLTGAVAPVAAVNNYLLPLGMILLGIAFIRYRSVEPITSSG
jgi:uncharacterized protein YndB with AHSA1/START domain